jgi:hypothetical protein
MPYKQHYLNLQIILSLATIDDVFSYAFSHIVNSCEREYYLWVNITRDRLCRLVVRVLGYRSGGPGSILGTTRKKSSGSGMRFTQPREYN